MSTSGEHSALTISYLRQPLTDQQRSERLFRGELLVFRQLPALLELQQLLHSRISEQLGISQPPRLFNSTAINDQVNHQLTVLTALQEEIRRDSGLRNQFYRALSEAGVDTCNSFSDTLQLRVVGPETGQQGRDRGGIGHHRDTWGSNIQAQVNWWTPLYPVTDHNTIAFYPDYWNQPVPNTSADWRFAEFLAHRASTPANQPLNYPYAPQPLIAIDDQFQQPIVIAPGDLLCFASAHLHGSTVNTTDLTRFSLEMRTVTAADLNSPLVPDNLDNAGSDPMYAWFKRLSDQISLKSVLDY